MEAVIGFVYVMTNESMPGIVKIGMSENVWCRARQLFSTSVPTPFDVYYSLPLSNPKKFEREIHKRLAWCRVHESREFFWLQPQDARELVESIACDLHSRRYMHEMNEDFDVSLHGMEVW